MKIVFFFMILLVSILISSFSQIRVNDSFLNTVYTIFGIMFSIGMGVVCTFNPERVKNKNYLLQIKKDIYKIRNNYIFCFAVVSLLYVLNQFMGGYKLEYRFFRFEMPLFLVGFSVIGVIYFIVNFLEIQKLNFDISERINSEV